MKKIILAIILLPLSSKADFYCADPAEVAAKVQGDCKNNEYYSEAAVFCMEKFEKALKQAQNAAKASLAAAKAQKGQAGAQKNAMLKYNMSKDVLDSLINQAKQAQEEVLDYREQLPWGEDADEPATFGGDIDAMLNDEPCHKDNKDFLAEVAEDFDIHLAQLEDARDLAEGLESSTSGNASDATSYDHNKAVNTSGAKAAPKKPRGKADGFGKSGISERDPKKKKSN